MVNNVSPLFCEGQDGAPGWSATSRVKQTSFSVLLKCVGCEADKTEQTNWDRDRPLPGWIALPLAEDICVITTARTHQSVKLMCNHRSKPDIRANLMIFGSHNQPCKYLSCIWTQLNSALASTHAVIIILIRLQSDSTRKLNLNSFTRYVFLRSFISA